MDKSRTNSNSCNRKVSEEREQGGYRSRRSGRARAAAGRGRGLLLTEQCNRNRNRSHKVITSMHPGHAPYSRAPVPRATCIVQQQQQSKADLASVTREREEGDGLSKGRLEGPRMRSLHQRRCDGRAKPAQPKKGTCTCTPKKNVTSYPYTATRTQEKKIRGPCKREPLSLSPACKKNIH
jgi:hypothetical protein